MWTGIEYQVAAHLIYEGLVMEGLAIARAVRDRYDGERRNPWNEVECGSHYARALASWSLLLGLSGYEYSAPDAHLAFSPRLNAESFRCLFTTGSGWGTFNQHIGTGEATASLELAGGTLMLRQFGFAPGPVESPRLTAAINRAPITARLGEAGLATFDAPVQLKVGDRLEVRLKSRA